MLNKNLYVGISFHLDDKCSDIWANGAVQNIIFLYQLLEKIPFVKKVSLVYLGGRSTPPDGLFINDIEIDFQPLDQVVHELDLLIEGTVMIDNSHCDIVHKNNGKVVSYRMGNDFILEMESFLFDKEPPRFFNGATYDAMWTIPQHENTCRSYFSIVSRSPLYVLPHIWTPFFAQKVINKLDSIGVEFGYKPGRKAKRISCFEANMNVVKTNYIPVLGCEQAYRQRPELIEHVYMCNTVNKKDHKAYHNFIGRTDIVKNNIMTVEGRFQMPDFLARYTDVVIAHQWENALNYAYYDALHGGYPLVHNSHMLPVGYQYRGFDAFDAANVLIDVIENHDKQYVSYQDKAKAFLATLAIDHPKNIAAHAHAIEDLFK